MNNVRSALSGARGLGSAKSGTGHFWAQRVTAVALVPLTLWFVACLASQFGADYDSITAWLSSPFQASLLVAYLIAIFYHVSLGLQTVIEDYVHCAAVKVASIVALQLISTLLAVAGIISVFMIYLGAD